jgi:hypothetical protein
MDPFILQYKQRIQELSQRVMDLTEELEICDEILEYVEPALEDIMILEEVESETSGELTEEKDKKWIQKAIEKKGALRKSLKAKNGKNIPKDKLEQASKKGGKVGKRARLAKTLKKMAEKKDKETVSEKEKQEEKKK